MRTRRTSRKGCWHAWHRYVAFEPVGDLDAAPRLNVALATVGTHAPVGFLETLNSLGRFRSSASAAGQSGDAPSWLLFEQAVTRAAARMERRRQALPDHRAALEQELAEVEGRLQKGLKAIVAAPEFADEFRALLRPEQDRKAAILAQLAALKAGQRGQAHALDARSLRGALRARVREVEGLLKGGHPSGTPDPPDALGRTP